MHEEQRLITGTSAQLCTTRYTERAGFHECLCLKVPLPTRRQRAWAAGGARVHCGLPLPGSCPRGQAFPMPVPVLLRASSPPPSGGHVSETSWRAPHFPEEGRWEGGRSGLASFWEVFSSQTSEQPPDPCQLSTGCPPTPAPGVR